MINKCILLCCLLCIQYGWGFAPNTLRTLHNTKIHVVETRTNTALKYSIESNNRRSLIGKSATLISTLLITNYNPSISNAAVMDASKNRGTLNDLSIEEATERFRAGRASVEYLLNNYNEICDGGGDNVRRYLGTVGTQSGLFGISKAMKTLADKADDIVEYTELSREIEQCIEQADGSAYMAIFVTTSTSYTPPAKYFADAKIEVTRLAKAMDDLSKMIGLSL